MMDPARIFLSDAYLERLEVLDVTLVAVEHLTRRQLALQPLGVGDRFCPQTNCYGSDTYVRFG